MVQLWTASDGSNAIIVGDDGQTPIDCAECPCVLTTCCGDLDTGGVYPICINCLLACEAIFAYEATPAAVPSLSGCYVENSFPPCVWAGYFTDTNGYEYSIIYQLGPDASATLTFQFSNDNPDDPRDYTVVYQTLSLPETCCDNITLDFLSLTSGSGPLTPVPPTPGTVTIYPTSPQTGCTYTTSLAQVGAITMTQVAGAPGVWSTTIGGITYQAETGCGFTQYSSTGGSTYFLAVGPVCFGTINLPNTNPIIGGTVDLTITML